jgi:hypothetical protein
MVSSSASSWTNILMFKLLILGHLNSSSALRFNTKTTDTFLIEMPTNISLESGQTRKMEVDAQFRFLAVAQGLPR